MRLLESEWQWSDYEEITSTNDFAKKIKLANPTQKILITAKKQTKGRGRRGRSWISEVGNLFFSQLFQTNIFLPHLAFIVSLSVAQTMMRLTFQNKVQLKWPNDVLINGKKVCGILIETQISGNIIVGVGVNLVSHPQNQKVIYPTICLSEVGIQISREEFLQQYLSYFESNLKEYQKDGFEKIRIEWQNNAYQLNKKIIINQEQKQEEGIFKGIDENGFLLLEQKEKMVKISVGDMIVSGKG